MKRHPLEERLNASAEDILSAVLAGFRAIVDVKGKLAELFLNRKLEALKEANSIGKFTWNDKDGLPDFDVTIDRSTVIMECKNVRSPKRKNDPCRVELQKTRNSKDGSNTRAYPADGGFDIIAVALFNQTREWDYLYALSRDLAVRADDPKSLQIYHNVPLTARGIWSGDLLGTLKKAAALKSPQSL